MRKSDLLTVLSIVGFIGISIGNYIIQHNANVLVNTGMQTDTGLGF